MTGFVNLSVWMGGYANLNLAKLLRRFSHPLDFIADKAKLLSALGYDRDKGFSL